MALDYNKRLRYFATEAEYEAFVEQQRQAAEAGTLELMETTVCCITHGNTQKPDTYLPSHDEGDEDIIMHYNATDDIRYVPFINPMWVLNGCRVKTENGESFPVFRSDYPIHPPTATLPDVIDGQQITKIDESFTRRLVTWPSFSNTNVRSMRFLCSYWTYPPKTSLRLTLPSSWPNLETITIIGEQFYYEYAGFEVNTFPIFGEENKIVAPKLKTVSFPFFVDGYTTYKKRALYDLGSVPKFYAPIESFQISLGEDPVSGEAFYGASLDFDDVFNDASHLTSLTVTYGSSSALLSAETYRVWKFKLTHSGESVTIPTINLRYIDSTTKRIELDVQTSAGSIACNSMALSCDFHNSVALSDATPKTLYITNCESSASSDEAFMSHLVNGDSSLSLDFPSVTQYRLIQNNISNILVSYLANAYYLDVYANAGGVGQKLTVDLTINPSSATDRYVRLYEQTGGSSFEEIRLIYPSINYGLRRVPQVNVLTVPANNLVIEGNIYSYNRSVFSSIRGDYAIDEKKVINYMNDCSMTGYEFKYFIPYSYELMLDINKEIPEGIECKLKGEHSYQDYYARLSITASVNITSFSLSIDESINYFSFVRISAPSSSITVTTIELLLDVCEQIENAVSGSLGRNGELTLNRITYNQLSSHYLDILNMFNKITIYEN